jgi:hypothetical protein
VLLEVITSRKAARSPTRAAVRRRTARTRRPRARARSR